MLNTLGSTTKSTFLKEVENHKLHQEFEVAAATTIYKGQPVKLDATGKIVPAGAAETEHTVIGYAIMNGAAGELVTVGMRGYGIVWVESVAAVVPGPVKYTGYNATTEYNQVDSGTVTQANAIGWALDVAAGADELVRMVIK